MVRISSSSSRAMMSVNKKRVILAIVGVSFFLWLAMMQLDFNGAQESFKSSSSVASTTAPHLSEVEDSESIEKWPIEDPESSQAPVETPELTESERMAEEPVNDEDVETAVDGPDVSEEASEESEEEATPSEEASEESEEEATPSEEASGESEEENTPPEEASEESEEEPAGPVSAFVSEKVTVENVFATSHPELGANYVIPHVGRHPDFRKFAEGEKMKEVGFGKPYRFLWIMKENPLHLKEQGNGVICVQEKGGHGAGACSYRIDLNKIPDGQKINYVSPGVDVRNKGGLCRSIRESMKEYGEQMGEFQPKCFLIPDHKQELKNAAAADRDAEWIYKPIGESGGHGVKLLKPDVDYLSLPNGIVQRYISKPLLIFNRKIDLRMYTSVPSFDPPRIYFARMGKGKFAYSEFGVDKQLSTVTNVAVHVVGNKDYVMNWGYHEFKTYLERLGVDVESVEQNMMRACTDGVLAFAKKMSCKNGRYSCGKAFQHFGVDLTFDENLKPYMLEANMDPAFNPKNYGAVNNGVHRALLRMVGVHPTSYRISAVPASFAAAVLAKHPTKVSADTEEDLELLLEMINENLRADWTLRMAFPYRGWKTRYGKMFMKEPRTMWLLDSLLDFVDAKRQCLHVPGLGLEADFAPVCDFIRIHQRAPFDEGFTMADPLRVGVA